MKWSKSTTVRLAAIGSLLASLGAFTLGALPPGSVSDKLLYASLFIRLYAAELMPLVLLAVLCGVGYVVYPIWAASAPVRWLLTADDARKMRLIVHVCLSLAALVVGAVAVLTVFAWARYTFIYLREDLLSSHLRRMALLEARLDEARGDLPSAVLKLQRFARMFPERAEDNDIAGDVQRLEAETAESKFLSELADKVERSSGINEAVVELRSRALAIWPAQPGSREKLASSVTRWGLALDTYSDFRASCEESATLEPKQVALSLVVQGFKHPQDFPGASNLSEAGKPLCALARSLFEDRPAMSKMHKQALKLLASTTPEQLALRARSWEVSSWTHNTQRYHSARMQTLTQGLWYRLVIGTAPSNWGHGANEDKEVAQEESPYPSFLWPAKMLDTATPTTTHRNINGGWPIKVIPALRGDILLCWSKPIGLLDVSISGPASASVVTLSPKCAEAERQIAPLNLRTQEVRQYVVDLISTATERIAHQTRPADRQALRSMCFMLARLTELEMAASDSASVLCKLEIMVDQLSRQPQTH